MLENPKAVLATTWTAKLSVNATKVEKTNTDDTWLNPKCCNNGQSAAKFLELNNTKLMLYNISRKRFNDYSVRKYTYKRLVCGSGAPTIQN